MDERYFTRILLNLLSNAVKYNRIGGTVRVDLAARENTWLLEIANTGRGIPPGHRAKLFERFFRSDDGSAPPGHGLGLSLARELARAHAGDLVLFRASEVWSVFQLTLPRTISEPDLSALPLPEKVAPPVTLGTAVAITR